MTHRLLTDDAKQVAAIFFPCKNKLRFLMQLNKPTARLKQALDELWVKRLIMSRVEDGVLCYYSTTDFSNCIRWYEEMKGRPEMNWAMMESVNGNP